MVDNASTVELANYWKRDFLDMHVIQNDFTMTKDYMTMCKSFVLEQVPEEFELIQGAEFAYLCNNCYNNGTPEKPDLWKSSQREIELI